MRATSWKYPVSQSAASHRAGGRRRINAERKARAQKRREEIKELIGDEGILLCGPTYGRGRETILARHFGVHRSTICRDIATLRAEWRKEYLCPICRTPQSLPLKALTKLAKRGLWDGCTAERCEEVDPITNQRKAVHHLGRATGNTSDK